MEIFIYLKSLLNKVGWDEERKVEVTRKRERETQMNIFILHEKS